MVHQLHKPYVELMRAAGVLESLFVLALAAGGLRAFRLRHRGALAGVAVVTYLLLADLLAVFSVQLRGVGGVFAVFANTFLGPASMPLRAPGPLPLPQLFLAHPLLVRAARCGVCWLVASCCFRESNQLNPLVQRAYALDSLAMPFVGAGVVDAAEGVLLLWAQLLLRADSSAQISL